MPDQVLTKSIKCKLCKKDVFITPGLAEMEEHWMEYHPEALETLRERISTRNDD